MRLSPAHFGGRMAPREVREWRLRAWSSLHSGRWSLRDPAHFDRSCLLRSTAHTSSQPLKYYRGRDSAAIRRRPGWLDDGGSIVSGKFDEICVQTDDESSLRELDKEHFGKSVRERINVAICAKSERQLPLRYYYEIIEETADDFLVEGQSHSENQERFSEILTAYNELLPAFRVLLKRVKGDRTLESAIRDVMWSSFLIGLACDRERLENPEILERYTAVIAANARKGRSKKYDIWNDMVYKAFLIALPVAIRDDKNFARVSSGEDYAKDIKKYVQEELEKMKSDNPPVWKELSPNAVRTAAKRYIAKEKAGCR